MLKFVRYINERGGHAIMPALKKPPVEFGDIKSMFDSVLEHEQYISESINEVLATAVKENDFATQNWIQWFVSEQVEEESSVQAVIDKLNLVGEHHMYLFDRDILAMRQAADTGAAE